MPRRMAPLFLWKNNDVQAEIPSPRRRPLTRADCRALEGAGLVDLERHELVDGYLIPKAPKSHLHSIALLLLIEWLRKVFGYRHVAQGVSIEPGPTRTQLFCVVRP